MHFRCHVEAACAAHYQQAGHGGGLDRADDLLGRRLQEAYGADRHVMAGKGGCQGLGVGDIRIDGGEARPRGQLVGLARDRGDRVAAAQGFVDEAGTDTAGGADDCDLHAELLCCSVE